MNTIDALRIINAQVSAHNGNTDLWMALDEIEDLVAAYDSLAPDWSKAPEDARWYTINSDGTAYWHEAEPTPFSSSWESGTADWAEIVLISLGIDWRLLKWQRPEEAA